MTNPAPAAPTPPVPTPAEVAATVTPPAAPATPEAPAQETTDWKAEARKWEARAKDNKDAADKLAEIEEANRVAEQTSAERIAELEAKVTRYETRDQVAEWAKEIVKDSHIPASALRGSTEAELQAHFDELSTLIPKPADPPPPPPPAPFSGPTLLGIEPTGTGEAPLDAQIAAAEKEGNWAVAGQLKAMKLAQSQSTP